MKRFNKLLCLLSAVTVALLCLLTGCGGAEAAPGYRVKVVDALGKPYTEGVVVQFKQNGASAGMQVVNAEGVAAKDLADGEYTVELSFTDENAQYYYDTTDLTLTAEKKELTVTLAQLPTYSVSCNHGKPEDMPVTYTVTDPTGDEVKCATCGNKGVLDTITSNDKQYVVGNVDAGCTYVTLEKGVRNYFLFTPTKAGKYEFSLPGSNATLGYYGAPHFVQEHHAAEDIKDGKFAISIKTEMIGTGNTGTTHMVLGIDAGENTSATIAIVRIGEPDWDVSDEPWTTYKTTSELSKYTLPAGASLKDFDLKADNYTLVKDSKGWYHLNTADGPLVLMRLGEKSKYLDDFKTIVEKSRVGKHFYDENGKFIRKESYNECLLEYIAVMDEKAGVYPLTDDLKYIIQQRGDHYGWFDADGGQYLFKDQNGEYILGINKEISWLFPCCYIG